jgi:metal-responsive CopG/Arc/MetJ family transcriptional regulator
MRKLSRMRTTISLPDDLYAVVESVARDRRQSISQTVRDLLKRALGETAVGTRVQRSPVTGLLTIDLGRTITPEDVRALDDEE